MHRHQDCTPMFWGQALANGLNWTRINQAHHMWPHVQPFSLHAGDIFKNVSQKWKRGIYPEIAYCAELYPFKRQKLHSFRHILRCYQVHLNIRLKSIVYLWMSQTDTVKVKHTFKKFDLTMFVLSTQLFCSSTGTLDGYMLIDVYQMQKYSVHWPEILPSHKFKHLHRHMHAHKYQKQKPRCFSTVYLSYPCSELFS